MHGSPLRRWWQCRELRPRWRCWPLVLAYGSFGVDLVTKIMVYAIFALSLELLVGGTGLVCFGQAAFFGIGAYAAVLLSASRAAAITAVAAAGLHRGRRRSTRLRRRALSLRTRACTSSWSRWPSRRWPTTWSTTRRWAAAPTASTSTPSRCWPSALLDLDRRALLASRWLRSPSPSSCWRGAARSPSAAALAGIRVNEAAHARGRLLTYPYKLAAFVALGAHRRAGRLPLRGEGRLRQPRADELAPVRARC